MIYIVAYGGGFECPQYMTEKNIRVKRMKLHNLSWSEQNYASGKVV